MYLDDGIPTGTKVRFPWQVFAQSNNPEVITEGFDEGMTTVKAPLSAQTRALTRPGEIEKYLKSTFGPYQNSAYQEGEGAGSIETSENPGLWENGKMRYIPETGEVEITMPEAEDGGALVFTALLAGFGAIVGGAAALGAGESVSGAYGAAAGELGGAAASYGAGAEIAGSVGAAVEGGSIAASAAAEAAAAEAAASTASFGSGANTFSLADYAATLEAEGLAEGAAMLENAGMTYEQFLQGLNPMQTPNLYDQVKEQLTDFNDPSQNIYDPNQYTPSPGGPPGLELPNTPPTPPGGNGEGPGQTDFDYPDISNDLNGPGGENLLDNLGLPPGTNNIPSSLWEKIINGTASAADWSSLAGLLGSGLGMYASGQQAESLEELTRELWAREDARYADMTAREQARFDTLMGREDRKIQTQNQAITRGIRQGKPYRQRLNQSMQEGFDPMSIAGYAGAVDTASDSILAGLSTQGNPYGNPGGLIEANKKIIAGTALPAIQQYQDMNFNASGLGPFGQAAATVPGTNSSLPGSISQGNPVGVSGVAGQNGPAMGAIQQQGNMYNAGGYGLDQLLRMFGVT